MLRGILNAVPMTVLMVAVVGITLALVVGLVSLIRRFVPASRWPGGPQHPLSDGPVPKRKLAQRDVLCVAWRTRGRRRAP